MIGPAGGVLPLGVDAVDGGAVTGVPYVRREVARRLTALAVRQGGLFTRAQALDCGYSVYQVRRRIQVCAWSTLLGPVIAPAGLAVTPGLCDRALGLAVPAVVLAGVSAARVHGVDVADTNQYGYLPPGVRVRTPAGVRLWRHDLPETDLCTVGGFRITSLARTVFDLVCVLPQDAAVLLLDRALAGQWITWADFAVRARAWRGGQRSAVLAAPTGRRTGPRLRPRWSALVAGGGSTAGGGRVGAP